MPTHKPRVLNVGQCDFDHGNIQGVLSDAFGAEVVRAADGEEALRAAGAQRFDLVLVNRVLDANGGSGLDVISQLRASDAAGDVPVMLVSNYDDAQDAAVALGAHRGFGKSNLTGKQTRDRLSAILANPVRQTAE